MSNTEVEYLDTGNNSYTWFADETHSQEALPPLNAMYTSSLLAPASVKDSSMDMWGNVKIPYLSRLNTSEGSRPRIN